MTGIKLTVFNGSPRGMKGNTHVMVAEFIAGAEQAGVMVENIFLVEKKIGHCLGCFKCWVYSPGRCVIRDDMEELLELYLSSELVVFATPLYIDNVSGIMKNFMDRLIPVVHPYFDKDRGGECRHFPRPEKMLRLAVISNCGFPEQSHFQVLKLLFRRIARNMNSELVAEIYRGGGEIFANTPEPLIPSVDAYRELLRQAGKEAVSALKLSQRTMVALEQPLLPDELYIAGARQRWDSQLAFVDHDK